MPAGSGASGKSRHSEDRTGRWDRAWWGASQERHLIFLSGSYFSQLFPFSLTWGRAGTGSVGVLLPAVMELTGAESPGGSPSAPHSPQPSGLRPVSSSGAAEHFTALKGLV